MVKLSKIITKLPRTLENPNNYVIKSVFIEILKISHELTKTIRQAEKVSQVRGAEKFSTCPLYCETTKSEKFLIKKKDYKKKTKKTKQKQQLNNIMLYEGYASNYNVKSWILLQLQLKDTEKYWICN